MKSLKPELCNSILIRSESRLWLGYLKICLNTFWINVLLHNPSLLTHVVKNWWLDILQDLDKYSIMIPGLEAERQLSPILGEFNFSSFVKLALSVSSCSPQSSEIAMHLFPDWCFFFTLHEHTFLTFYSSWINWSLGFFLFYHTLFFQTGFSLNIFIQVW